MTTKKDLVNKIEEVIKGLEKKTTKGGSLSKSKYKVESDEEYDSDEYLSDCESDSEDENDKLGIKKYGMDKVYNYGGSERYSYRKKKYANTIKKPRQQSDKNKNWMQFVALVRKQNPELKQRDVLHKASKMYKEL